MRGIVTCAFVLCAALGLAQGRQSLLYEIARMMGDPPVEQVGTCGQGCCVEIDRGNGVKETRLLNIDESVGANSDNCTRYTCTVSGISKTIIETCKTPVCDSGNPPVLFPGQCCPQCVSTRKPGNCSFTKWSEYGMCSVTCGEGQQARVRRVISVSNSVDFVNCSGNLTEVRMCDAGDCPEPCLWRPVEVGECIPDCGGGERRRYYIITRQETFGGRPCPRFVIENETEIIECCQHCEWEYEKCDPCPTTCGTGVRKCYPRVIQQARGGGRDCPEFAHNRRPQEEECPELPPCIPVDCEWEYRNCGQCSATCGSAIRQCTPVITQHSQHGGKECPDFVRRGERQTLTCSDLRPCEPEDCEWEYRNCGSCSATCGSGTRQCTPVITKSAKHGGKECPDFVHRGERQNLKCENLPTCEPEDCEWEYRNCGSCSATCGSGTRQCTPVITKSAKHGGKECPDFVRRGERQNLKCENLPTCPPEDCEWEYRNCGSCSATCGSATRQCRPVITKSAKHGGKECPDFVRRGERQNLKCENLPTCPPEDCEWEYRNCGSCSATCGSGTRQCTPVITKSARHGGKDCPDFVRRGQHQTLKCKGLQPCPTTCNDDEHICVVRGVEVCVKNIVDPNEECKCILTYQNRIIDLDLDFIHNNCDNCNKVSNGDQKDEDGDSVGDECDNCKTDKNRDQKDVDGDKIGDVCDPNNEISPFEAQSFNGDKKSMAAAIMEKLMEMYYSE